MGQTADTERGQSLTELALVLPMLILLILGGLDLVRVYNHYVTVTNAAREGARFSASRPASLAADVKPRVWQELGGTGIQQSDVTVFDPTCVKYSDNSTIACTDALTGDYITVKVSVPFRFVTLLIVDEGHSVMDISSTATMPVILP